MARSVQKDGVEVKTPSPPLESAARSIRIAKRVPRVAELPVASVTVLEDRAHVLRRGNLILASASERVVVERVAPVASDKSLIVTVMEGNATVVDARIRRRATIRLRERGDASGSDVSDERAGLENERDQLRETLSELVTERDVRVHEAAALERATELALAELSEDVAWGAEIEATWGERLDQLSGAERALARSQVETECDLEQLELMLARLGERIDALDGPAEEERADLEIDLQGAAGAACVLRVEYAVPGACWRPCHTARLRDAVPGRSAHVDIDTDACVWQNTGEDWREVEIVLSTERVSLGVEPPRLTSDVLRAVRRAETTTAPAREQEIDTTGLGGAAGSIAAPRAAAVELPGIDDAGQVLTLRAADRASIPSDGRPYRVRLGSFQSDAELELCAFPELTSSVVLKSVQVNRGAGPLLAGPVDLVRESGLCGRTAIRYVAAGERFELGWGADADVRVSREVEVIDEKSRTRSTWSVRRTHVHIKLSNLSSKPRAISVVERLPVSEAEKVRIAVDLERVTGRRGPDENGFLRWPVVLEPFGHDDIELAWELRRHEDVVGV